MISKKYLDLMIFEWSGCQYVCRMEFKKYTRKNATAEMAKYVPGTELPSHVTVSDEDKKNGSPKEGDMIVRDKNNHSDMWLISAAYFEANFAPVEGKP